ncbi:response regulator [uncultured Aquimonas sp.]|jgi:twitching motility two-component system response regulator PilH|uniref:response regulator transcription factor n=1 Tax=uncultured Aquimonas sp. TaxID=385483 RepID=UPI00086AD7A2|nr:response regulator [uncultured Aquimonas sp.]ODU43659.1 MAG: two-component system response regulator [Xanthomonadaceae bacterium SCN 69-123]
MARILIIEDSPTDTRVFSQMLERGGHTVSAAASAEDGIAVAEAELPDLILMDVILPGMSGFQATRSLSRSPKTQHIPIIIVSTKGMETDRVWGLRQGAKDYVVKPPAEADLLGRINALVKAGARGSA